MILSSLRRSYGKNLAGGEHATNPYRDFDPFWRFDGLEVYGWAEAQPWTPDRPWIWELDFKRLALDC